jgi:hypothetical protein
MLVGSFEMKKLTLEVSLPFSSVLLPRVEVGLFQFTFSHGLRLAQSQITPSQRC